MATSKFERRFTNAAGEPLLGATIELIPQANTYPEGKITLIEHPTRKGWYYKDAVPLGEYKIYINGSLYTQNIFHAENILYYLVGKFNDQLIYIGEIAPIRIQLPKTPPSLNKPGNIYFDEVSQTIKIDIAGNGQYIPIGGGSSSGVVLISGDQTIGGIKVFSGIDMQPISGTGLALPLTPPNTYRGRRTGAIYYDAQNNVLKISKDGTGNNFLVLGSSEGENFVSLHGLSVHDGQINGVGIYLYHDALVYALPLRNNVNNFFEEDVPGAVYVSEEDKCLYVNFGRSHYGEEGTYNDEYHAILPIDKVLEVIKEDPQILTGAPEQQREFHGRISARGGASIDLISGRLQLPDVNSMGDPQYYKNAIWADNTYQNETGQRKFRLKVRFDDGGSLTTETFISLNEIKDYIQCGIAQFSGTSTQCTVPNGGSVNDIYFVTPIGTSWNVNDMLIVSAENGQFTVTRNAGGTNNLQFYWIRRKYGTY